MAKAKNSVSIIKMIVVWVLFVPAVFFGYPTLFVLAIGMAPTIISLLVERLYGKPATLCIGSFNFCGVIPYIILLWEEKQRFNFALSLFYDPNTLCLMYGCAFIGYAIYWGVPRIILGSLRITARSRIKKLKQVQEQLVEEWGEEVKGPQPKTEEE